MQSLADFCVKRPVSEAVCRPETESLSAHRCADVDKWFASFMHRGCQDMSCLRCVIVVGLYYI